jgi:hypothetical protein
MGMVPLKAWQHSCTSAWRHGRNWNTFTAGRCQDLNAGTLMRTRSVGNFKSDDMNSEVQGNPQTVRMGTDHPTKRTDHIYPAFQLNGR